jgi:pimeloyl-ACP methyl ester carboxylesterase
VVAVGHSFGAILALAAAGREPRLIDAVISLDQVVDVQAFTELAHGIIPYWRDVRGAIERARGDADLLVELLGDLVSASERRRVASSWAPQDPAVFDSIHPDRFHEWALDPSIADLPGKFRGPVLFIDGDPDAGSIVGPEPAVRNLALYPWAQRVKLGGVGHGLDLDTEPSAVVDAVNSFVSDLRRAACR